MRQAIATFAALFEKRGATAPPHHEYDFAITHVYFVDLLGRMARGKTGADDGVLEEFLQKLLSERQVRLLYLLQDILMGGRRCPSFLEVPLRHALAEDRWRD